MSRKSREELLHQINLAAEEIAPTLEKLKIGKDYLAVHKDDDYEEILEGHRWIYEIYNTHYTNILNVRKLLPETLWKRYEMWGGFDEHRECLMLREAEIAFRKVVVSQSRPEIFKKGINHAKQTSKIVGDKGRGKVERKRSKQSELPAQGTSEIAGD